MKMAIQVGGTTVVDNSRNLTNIGTGSFSSNVTVAGTVNAYERSRAVTMSGTTNIDMNNGDSATHIKLTVAASATLNFTNLPNTTGSNLFSWAMTTINDGTAGRAITWGNTILWAGGLTPTRTTTANARDVWTFFVENGTIHGSLAIIDAK